jgi:hypothetical protein
LNELQAWQLTESVYIYRLAQSLNERNSRVESEWQGWETIAGVDDIKMLCGKLQGRHPCLFVCPGLLDARKASGKRLSPDSGSISTPSHPGTPLAGNPIGLQESRRHAISCYKDTRADGWRHQIGENVFAIYGRYIEKDDCELKASQTLGKLWRSNCSWHINKALGRCGGSGCCRVALLTPEDTPHASCMGTPADVRVTSRYNVHSKSRSMVCTKTRSERWD